MSALPPAKKQKTLHAVPGTARTCAACHQVKAIQSFSKKQRKKGADAKCTDCTNTGPSLLPKKECSCCSKPKTRGAYGKAQWKLQEGATCTECIQAKKECSDCNTPKPLHAYEQDQWKLQEGAICKECTQYPPKECSDCKHKRSRHEYSGSQYKLQEDAVCKECHHAALEKKRVEEIEHRERLSKEPRQCVLCNQKKTEEAFSTHQWGPYIESEMT